MLIGFQDTGKRTQLSCLGVPAWLTVILSSE